MNSSRADTSPLAVVADGAALPTWKRAIDFAFCLAAIPLLLPLTAWMFLLTRCWAPGPVLFRQQRVGLDGRQFCLLKFRTMVVGGHATVHRGHCEELIRSNRPMVKMDSRGDRRLIPGGWLLRASGLDELPQLINILRGEMTLVGPRPCTPYEYAHYAPWQRERFSTVPGLTGLWQVSGKNKTTFEEMIRLDIHYARHVSLAHDLKIIALTPATLVRLMLEARTRRTPPAPARDNAPAAT